MCVLVSSILEKIFLNILVKYVVYKDIFTVVELYFSKPNPAQTATTLKAASGARRVSTYPILKKNFDSAPSTSKHEKVDRKSERTRPKTKPHLKRMRLLNK